MREVCNAEWDDIQHRLREKDAEIERLEALLTRAADALEELDEWVKPTWIESAKPLIAELRKAAPE
jgi:arginine deiminase